LVIVLQEQRIPGAGHADAAEERILPIWIDVLVGKCPSVGGQNERTGKFAAARTVVGKASALSAIRPLFQALRRR
jgi:hypothetical protein